MIVGTKIVHHGGYCMKLMEWNINGRGGHNYGFIPVRMIIDEIMNISPDVIVLLEFIKAANGWCDLNTALDKLGYVVYTTKYLPGKNGVLIAIRKEWQSEKVTEDIEYLAVKMRQSNYHITIIGTRILTQDEYENFIERKKLFDALLNRLPNTPFIMLFDANNGHIQNEYDKYFVYKEGNRKHYNYQYIWGQVEDIKKWALITPDKGGRYTNGKYSIITGEHEPENYHTKEDHIISSFSEALFENADYIWDFVDRKNGYGKKKPTDVISDLFGLPDHGILVADFNLDGN